MNSFLVERLVTLRCIVGYLGEQGQSAWWPSFFFSLSSNQFLNPVFPRMPNLARYTGVTQAAALVHDQQIGIGKVYHLFRLPEELEQDLYAAARTESLWGELRPFISDRGVALAYLRSVASAGDAVIGGPVHAGDLGCLHQEGTYAKIAGVYALAFEQSLPTYPYLSEAAS